MARLGALCPDRTSSEGCPLGAHWRLRHHGEIGKEDDQRSNLVIGFDHPNGAAIVGLGDPAGGDKRRCFNHSSLGDPGSRHLSERFGFEHLPTLSSRRRDIGLALRSCRDTEIPRSGLTADRSCPVPLS